MLGEVLFIKIALWDFATKLSNDFNNELQGGETTEHITDQFFQSH